MRPPRPPRSTGRDVGHLRGLERSRRVARKGLRSRAKSPLLSARALAFSCGLIERELEREFLMADSTRPGPGRSTSDAAVNELKREIARRNAEVQKAARKLRSERERQLLARRRELDR